MRRQRLIQSQKNRKLDTSHALVLRLRHHLEGNIINRDSKEIKQGNLNLTSHTEAKANTCKHTANTKIVRARKTVIRSKAHKNTADEQRAGGYNWWIMEVSVVLHFRTRKPTWLTAASQKSRRRQCTFDVWQKSWENFEEITNKGCTPYVEGSDSQQWVQSIYVCENAMPTYNHYPPIISTLPCLRLQCFCVLLLLITVFRAFIVFAFDVYLLFCFHLSVAGQIEDPLYFYWIEFLSISSAIFPSMQFIL